MNEKEGNGRQRKKSPQKSLCSESDARSIDANQTEPASALPGGKKRRRDGPQSRSIPISRGEEMNKTRPVDAGTCSNIQFPHRDRYSRLLAERPDYLRSDSFARSSLPEDSARNDRRLEGYDIGHLQLRQGERSMATDHLLVGSGDMSEMQQVEEAIRSSLAAGVRTHTTANDAQLSSERLRVLQQMVRDEELRLRVFRQQEMVLRERETLRSLERESLRRHQQSTSRESAYDLRSREEELRELLSRDDSLYHSRLHQASRQPHRPMRDTLPLPFASLDSGRLSLVPNIGLGPDPREERLLDILSRNDRVKERQLLPEQQTTSQQQQGSRKSTRALALPSDKGVLSPYQSLIRESIQVFEAQSVDIDFFANSQGRNRKVELGQVGVRCQYCAHRPLHWCSRGAVYFPGSLQTIYQAAQNMAANHFLPGICEDMPESVKDAFVAESQKKKERTVKRSAGKEYWECACRSLGLEDRAGRSGVWFRQSK